MLQVKPRDFETKLLEIRDRLVERPQGLMIGNGIRSASTQNYTIFFEKIVNACRELSPDTQLLFNTSPLDIAETCQRLR